MKYALQFLEILKLIKDYIFSVVDLKNLLKRLEYYGMRGVTNFFCDHILHKLYLWIIQEEATVSGVPQGSVTRLIFFSLYINAISNVSDEFKNVLFAFDTNIFH